MTLSFGENADELTIAEGDKDAALTDEIVIGALPVLKATVDNDLDPFATPEELQAQAAAEAAKLSESALTKPDAQPKPLNKLAEAAASYAKNGWKVFPIWPIRNGKCACGMQCSSPGKHPLAREGFAKNGLLDATTDGMTIAAWWSSFPDANVGLVTGNGLVVLDVDPDKGGGESLKAITEKYNGGQLWVTPTVITGSGGLHFYFYSFKEFRNKAGRIGAEKYPGIDVRGDGGYVVAPPSNHISGGFYEWSFGQETPQCEWPWPEEDKPVAAEPVDGLISEGGRNAALTSIAGTMRRRGLDEDEIEAALLVANEKRCNPPLTTNEVRAIAKSVSRYEPEAPVGERTQSSVLPTTAVSQLAHRSDEFLNLEIKPPQWLVEHIWPERAIGFVSGPPKSFKSFFVLELAFAVATGRNFLDEFRVPRPARVLTIQAESDLSSFKDRVRRAKDHYGDAPNLFIISNKPLYLDNDVDLDRLRYEIKAIQPELVILDPMASFHRSDENNTQAMQTFVRAVRGIRDEFNTGILIVHHWTKTPPGDKNLRGGERMRGNTGLHGSAESSVYIRRVSDDVNRSNVRVELKESQSPTPFVVQFDPDTSALTIVTQSGILFGRNAPSKAPYYAED